MKVMRAFGPPTDHDRDRFLREARLTARLEHPGIVPVHELGEDADGNSWFAMKQVRGVTFDRACRPGGDYRRLVDVLLRICDAVGYAHTHGVIHRDIKPANIMVGAFGEVYVMDWGIAGHVDEEVTRIEGTPSWLAPEQARGERSDARTDVYAIGGLLYHALCGARPHMGDNPRSRMTLARETPVVPPQDLARNLPPELCRIAMRALAFRPADRYPSIQALRDDLDRAVRRGWWMETCEWPAGTHVIREGDDDESAWIIVEGTASVWQKGARLGTLGPGDSFGELALLCGEPRTATVVADTPLIARVIRAEVLEAALEEAWLTPMLRGLARRLRERERGLEKGPAGGGKTGG